MKVIRNLIVAAALAMLVFSLPEIAAQDVNPLPFSFVTVDGRVWAPQSNSGMHRLSFDVDFRLHQMSNGIGPGDSCTIETRLAYPTMAPNQPAGQASFWTLPLVRMILRVSVAGDCFQATDAGGFRFELSSQNRSCLSAILDLADVGGMTDARSRGNLSTYLDLTPIVREMEIVLIPRDRYGRWRLRSRADFFNPGYPFPVVGFGSIPGYGPSSTAILIGDDGGFAPFGGMVFEGSAGSDQGPCRPVQPRVRSQGFWKRQCKGPHPSGDDLSEYLRIVQLTDTFAEVGNVEQLCAQLSPSPSSDKCEQAEGQFMALLLNLASERLAPCNCVIDPDLGATTVAEALSILDEALANPNRSRDECVQAKEIADRMNRGETLAPCDSG